MAVIDVFRALLCRSWPLPDAVFVVRTSDVTSSAHDQHGTWRPPSLNNLAFAVGRPQLPVATADLLLRRSVGTRTHSAIAELSAHTPWAARRPKLVYSDDKAWESRIPGDPFRHGRRQIRAIARRRPELIHIPARPLPFERWGRFKFVLYLDGVGPSNRLQYLVALNSTVFVPDPVASSVHWLLPALKPFVHYVPVNRNLSNLVERIEWALSHDDEARGIAGRAAALVAEPASGIEHGHGGGLHALGRLCTWYSALRAVAEVQRGAVVHAAGDAIDSCAATLADVGSGRGHSCGAEIGEPAFREPRSGHR